MCTRSRTGYKLKSSVGSVLLMVAGDRDRQHYDNPVNFLKINVACSLREMCLRPFFPLPSHLPLLPFLVFFSFRSPRNRVVPPPADHVFAYKTAINDNGNCFLGRAITHNRYKPGLISPFGVSIKNMPGMGETDLRRCFTGNSENTASRRKYREGSSY